MGMPRRLYKWRCTVAHGVVHASMITSQGIPVIRAKCTHICQASNLTPFQQHTRHGSWARARYPCARPPALTSLGVACGLLRGTRHLRRRHLHVQRSTRRGGGRMTREGVRTRAYMPQRRRALAFSNTCLYSSLLMYMWAVCVLVQVRVTQGHTGHPHQHTRAAYGRHTRTMPVISPGTPGSRTQTHTATLALTRGNRHLRPPHSRTRTLKSGSLGLSMAPASGSCTAAVAVAGLRSR